MRAKLAFFTLCLLLPATASAQMRQIEYSAGTGFFVSRAGDIITNKHVIQSCKSGSIELRGAVTGHATPVATHAQYDLALLRADKTPPSVAPLLADDRMITPGDPVMVIGYPLEHAQTPEHKTTMSRVVGTNGPLGETQWIQFENSAQYGNSGGPLLDMSGHVIGVVTGKTELYSIDKNNRRQEISNSDIAVSLPILQGFLDARSVRYTTQGSMAKRMNDHVERNASQFIVNIRCITGEKFL